MLRRRPSPPRSPGGRGGDADAHQKAAAILRNFAILGVRNFKDRRQREQVRNALAEALRPDPACPQILGWTRLAHLELVRPHGGRPLAEALLEPRPGGPLIKTAVMVAHEASRALRREGTNAARASMAFDR